ncbi:glycerophosphodiester phosphodiesterase [Cohnella zeiphila]|uniref:Glycerophosphodiester phosphodiesterase n=1 Tax=Cohnella zeiphila TaxID=2761120 RepID=A0A7X0SN43_9BACL|nr:glycerophosphodiester phosphodiesterase [Cohnella zeiphila]MBB6733047.1 glycerophosphodiester phosphodiesterase [Cohnella zeiphila]
MKAPPFPLITAHAGCMDTPQNSIESIFAGLKHGADIVEDDIRATKDGALVLSHDDAIQLSDGRQLRISALTLQELSTLPQSPIVELRSALRIVKETGVLMNLDVKDDASLEPLADLIAALGMTDQVFLTGCEHPRAMLARSRAPLLRKLLNVQAVSFAAKAPEEAVRQACEEAESAGCFGLNVPYPLVSDNLLKRAEEAGLPLYVWTVDEPMRMKRCAEWGVQSITTRNVATLQAVKAHWNQETCRL